MSLKSDNDNPWTGLHFPTLKKIPTGSVLAPYIPMMQVPTVGSHVVPTPPFVLPEKWYVKVTPDNVDVLTAWKTKISNGIFNSRADKYECISYNGAGTCIETIIERGWQELSYSDFVKHVLGEAQNKPVTSKRVPKPSSSTKHPVLTKQETQELLNKLEGTHTYYD